MIVDILFIHAKKDVAYISILYRDVMVCGIKHLSQPTTAPDIAIPMKDAHGGKYVKYYTTIFIVDNDIN